MTNKQRQLRQMLAQRNKEARYKTEILSLKQQLAAAKRQLQEAATDLLTRGRTLQRAAK